MQKELRNLYQEGMDESVESFRIFNEKELAELGECRPSRLVLEALGRM